LAERVSALGISSLNRAELQTGDYKNGGRKGKPKDYLTDQRGRTEFGEDN
jgi:hypothetical protein